MIKYVLILKNRKKSLTEDLLNGHVEHLKNLDNAGILVLCGPLKDIEFNDGGMVIIEANDKKEAENYFLKDPFISEEYFGDYSIYELTEANKANNWLMGDK